MLAEANLEEIEEIPAKKIPPYWRGREANVHVEMPKVGVFQPDSMDRGRQGSPSGRLVGQLRSLEDVETESVSDPATEEGALRSGV